MVAAKGDEGADVRAGAAAGGACEGNAQQVVMSQERAQARPQSRETSREVGRDREGGGRRGWQERRAAPAGKITQVTHRRGRWSRDRRTARRQGEKDAVFKMQLALVVTAGASRTNVTRKWRSMAERLRRRLAAVPGWALQVAKAERTLGWMQEEMQHLLGQLEVDGTSGAVLHFLRKQRMDDIKEARRQLSKRRGEAVEAAGEELGLAALSAKELAVLATVEDARLVLGARRENRRLTTAATGEGISTTDYEVAALAERREAGLARLVEAEREYRDRRDQAQQRVSQLEEAHRCKEAGMQQ